MRVGDRVRELRKQKKLTQVELAQELGITCTTISNWETERNKMTSVDVIKSLCSYFDVSADYLLGLSDKP